MCEHVAAAPTGFSPTGMPPKAKGGKAKKGAAGKAASRGAGNRRNNPKAFLAAAGPKAMRNNAYRALEKQEKQYHVSLVDRSAEATVRRSAALSGRSQYQALSRRITCERLTY